MASFADWIRRQPRHGLVGGLGGLFIAVIVALSAYDIVRGHRNAVEATARELNAQARVIAEQTARSLQAVDVVLRHLADPLRGVDLSSLSTRELHEHLQQQAVGLVQIDGLAVRDGEGRTVALSWAFPTPPSNLSVVDLGFFAALRAHPPGEVFVGGTLQGRTDGRWVFPIARRIDRSDGSFGGFVGARGRVDYFQQFYRDVTLDTGTTIALLHADGTLMARHPPADGQLGRQMPPLEAQTTASGAPLRIVSPIDGVERFSAVHPVGGYPVSVLINRDVAVALAPWREQAIGTALRTLALGVLAASLLAVALRQLRRVQAVRDSLAESQERFSVAVAGSDDGIWLWDYVQGRAFASARAREILGAAPAPELQSIDEWSDTVDVYLHPDDRALRRHAIDEHLAGRTATYQGEYRVTDGHGGWRWIGVRGLCARDGAGRPQRMAGSVSDIDARKRAEEALRESEQRLALAMTGSHEGHWVWDIDAQQVFVSATLAQLFGFEGGAQTLSEANYFGGLPLHPDDRERVHHNRHEHVSGRTPRLDHEFRIVRTDGSVRWVHTRGQCFRDAAGRPRHLAGATMDVTDRHAAAQALRDSEERFALAVEGSNDGIVDWDIARDRMFTSRRAMQIAGVQAEALIRTRAEWLALLPLHPDDVARHTADFHRHLDGETEVREGDYRLRHPDGRYRWVRVRGMSVRDADGRAIRWAGSVSDIDAQKRTEEALRQSDERYQLAVEGSNQGLWDWDLKTDRLFLSPRAQRLNFVEPGEPLRTRREWIALTEYHPDDVVRVRRAIRDHLLGAAPEFSIDYRVRHHSGEWRWTRQRGVALRDAEGRPYRMAGSMEDISAPKHAEAERERLEQQLRQAQKLEAIGTLAGGIAHDFNNILAAILGYGEMALKDAPEGSSQRRHIDAAMSAGLRAKSLVERILAFSRSGMGERVPVHVQSVVAEALDVVAGSLPPGVQLERRLDAGDAAVLGDPTQIHQVVMNLCANAVQAMRHGGLLHVTAEVQQLAEAQPVSTSRLAPGRYVCLGVHDSGGGIDPAVLERIFDPFFTTKEVGVGTGLGLSLVHGIVTDLGGGVDVHSHPGQGSSFSVYLPWHAEAVAAVRVDEQVAGGAGETVLLVDDEEPLVRLGEEMLAELGYEPVGFASSRAALESFRASPQRFHAVLSDEAMPGMTGSELVAEIRKLRGDIPIIMMSGFVSPALTARAREAGVAEVLAKPLVSRDIARSLAAALRQANGRGS